MKINKKSRTRAVAYTCRYSSVVFIPNLLHRAHNKNLDKLLTNANLIRQNLLLFGHTYNVCIKYVYAWLIKTHGSVSCGPRKQGVSAQREYINTKNKVWFPNLRSSVVSWDQIGCASAGISGENTYQMWSKLRQPFLRYEPSKSCSFFSYFSYSFCMLA